MSFLKLIAQNKFRKIFGKGWSSREAFLKFLEGWKFADPILVVKNKCKFSIIEKDGWQIFCFAPKHDSKKTDKALYYMNGSAYVMAIGPIHYKYFIRLVNKTGATLYCPILPVYNNDGKNIDRDKLYECFVSCYKRVLELHTPNKVSVAGDSSGGGLALLLPTLVKKYNLPMPRRIMLLNPLADCDLVNFKSQNPSGKFIFPKVGLEVAIDIFRGNANINDPYISPIHTDFSILPDTYLFYGTWDEVKIDMEKLADKLKEYNKLTGLYAYPKCFHDFFVVPIPEAYKFTNDFKNVINQD